MVSHLARHVHVQMQLRIVALSAADMQPRWVKNRRSASNAQDMIICGPISSAQHVSMQATVPRRSAPFSHTDVQGSCERMHAPKPLSLLAGRTSSVGQA
ncbi:hypothetical protein T4E_11538 [Trichinella pseudospiralis]|uniref:Uncharacterized protein n=1 Tax=Trichinella pseudospiralis TaxID=6337 RepID=A0A0V0XHN9_TRIPS|nr:hypothetical protein T4E_11538 [Trichinella pseudospiralis]